MLTCLNYEWLIKPMFCSCILNMATECTSTTSLLKPWFTCRYLHRYQEHGKHGNRSRACLGAVACTHNQDASHVVSLMKAYIKPLTFLGYQFNIFMVIFTGLMTCLRKSKTIYSCIGFAPDPTALFCQHLIVLHWLFNMNNIMSAFYFRTSGKL